MSRDFIRSEQRSAAHGGMVAIYRQDVPWQPAPQVSADAYGVTLTGMHAVASREALNRLMSAMEAAWSDHLVLRMVAANATPSAAEPVAATIGDNVLALAHGKSRSEQGGSSV